MDDDVTLDSDLDLRMFISSYIKYILHLLLMTKILILCYLIHALKSTLIISFMRLSFASSMFKSSRSSW